MGKQHLLMEQSVADLKKKLEESREELSTLRVTQAANSNASKVNQITGVRKEIARILTAVNQKAKAAVRETWAGKKYIPKDLRQKKTRAMRRALSKSETHVLAKGQKGAVVKKLVPRTTLRQAKKLANRKKLTYAVLAEN
jgi:large subunit ribosomal protein L35e